MQRLLLPQPDRPGSLLVWVLHLALLRVPRWWSHEDLRRMEALPQLALADVIARVAQRNATVLTQGDLAHRSPEEITAAEEAHWIHRIPAPTLGLIVQEVALAVGPEAIDLIHDALAVVTAGEPEAWSHLIRICMGQIPVPSGCPLDKILHGYWPTLDSLPWADRADCQRWRVAQAARVHGPGMVPLPALLQHLHDGEGAPLRLLGHHRTELHAWCRLAWSEYQARAPHSAEARRLLRALRRCPLEPRLESEVWTALWRHHRLRPLGQRLARHYARWGIWTASESQRWKLRAEGAVRRAKDRVWPEQHLAAWLSHDIQGHVLADGVRVEARVLAHLRRQGWDGIHAEGWFWRQVVDHLAADLHRCPVPGAWVAPLQLDALDRSRRWWGQRRLVPLADLNRRLGEDPEGTLRAALPPDTDPHLAATALAVAKHLPRTALRLLIRRLVLDPDAASGLPDLVVWRGENVALWEVKSPGDALRDAQREWLHWGRANGLTVGVWHVEPKESIQSTLFQLPPQSAAKLMKVPSPGPRSTAPQAPRSPQQRVEWIQADDSVPLVPGTLLKGVEVPLAAVWFTSSATRSEIRVHGEGVRVLRWGTWQPRMLQCIRHQGRKIVERLWHHLPESWVIPVAVICQPAPQGGLMEAAVIPVRRAGWWWPERFDHEPVVLPREDQDTDPRTWGVHPEEAPLRGDHHVDPAELDLLRAMVGAEPYAVGRDSRGPWLAVDPALGLLWATERIVRRDLGEVLQEWRVSDQTHNP